MKDLSHSKSLIRYRFLIKSNNSISNHLLIKMYIISWIRQVNVIRDIYSHIPLPLDSISSSEPPPCSVFPTSLFLLFE